MSESGGQSDLSARITLRAVLWGMVFAGFFAWFTTVRENRPPWIMMTPTQIAVLPYMLLVIMVLLLNPLFRLCRLIRVFSPTELLIIFVMGAVSSGISTYGMAAHLVPIVGSLSNEHWNNEQRRWDIYVEPYLNEKFFIAAEGTQEAARRLEKVESEWREAKDVLRAAQTLQDRKRELANVRQELEALKSIENARERFLKQKPVQRRLRVAKRLLKQAEKIWDEYRETYDPDEVCATYKAKIKKLGKEKTERKKESDEVKKWAFQRIHAFRRGLPPEMRAIPGFLYVSEEGLASYAARVKRLVRGRAALRELKRADGELDRVMASGGTIDLRWEDHLLTANALLADVADIPELSRRRAEVEDRLERENKQRVKERDALKDLRNARRYAPAREFANLDKKIELGQKAEEELGASIDLLRRELKSRIQPQLAVCERVVQTRDGLENMRVEIGSAEAEAQTAVSAKEWIYAAGIYDGKEMRLYTNGVLAAAVPGLPQLTYDGAPLAIGAGSARGSVTNACFQGDIDEVRLSSVVRTPAWLATCYNNQRAPAEFITLGPDETLGPEGTPGAEAKPGYRCRRTLTIDGGQVAGDEPLADFPLLVSLADPALKTTDEEDGRVVSKQGYDIIFTGADALTQLDHEIETYNPSTGTFTGWVRLRGLPPGTNTTIYVYYGNPSILESQENAVGVWDAGYAGVWHLAAAPRAATNLDSTAHGNHAAARNMDEKALVKGKIGKCLRFDGIDDSLCVADAAALRPALLTLELWYNRRRDMPAPAYRFLCAKGYGVDDEFDSYALGFKDNKNVFLHWPRNREPGRTDLPGLKRQLAAQMANFRSFDASLRRFWIGDTPWRLWFGPLWRWTGLILLTYLVLMTFNVLIFRQWAHNEKLVYPLAELPTILGGGVGERTGVLPPIFKDGLFWVGFSISFCVLGWNYLAKEGIIPGVNPIELKHGWTPYVRGSLFDGLRGFNFNIFFTLIGLTFLIPAKISFSLWFFHILWTLQLLVMVWLGYGANYWSFRRDWSMVLNFRTAQGGGALLVFALFILWKCRPYIFCAFSDRAIRSLEPDERRELRMASWLFMLGSLALVAVLTCGMKVNVFYAALFYFVILVVTIGLVRAVAEGGVLGFQCYFGPFHLVRSLFGMDHKWSAPQLMAPLWVYQAVLFMDIKAFIAPAMANALKVRDTLRMRRARFHLAVALGILCAFGIALASHLILAYTHGADGMRWWFYRRMPEQSVFETVKTMIQSNPVDNAGGQWWLLVGGLLMVGLLVGRRHCFWMPHPIGLMMLVNPMMRGYWGSILLGWAFKSLVSKYGNKDNYVRFRYLFIGLIVGELLMCLLGIHDFDRMSY